MPRFEMLEDGVRVAPGFYALVAQDSCGVAPHPSRRHGRLDELLLPPVDRPAIMLVGDLEMLVLPMGCDRAGGEMRSIAIGSQTIIASERIALVPVEEPLPSPGGYMVQVGRMAGVVVHDGAGGGFVRLAEGGFELQGFGYGVDWIDTYTPGAFSLETETFDMAHAKIAAIFGYGSEAFNAALDHQGFRCDVKALRKQLAGRTDPEAVAVLRRLPTRDAVIARYAPVIP